MDHTTARTPRVAEPDVPDVIDLALLDMLRSHARTEVHELARRVGLSTKRVRVRLRRLERAGLIRGYYVRTSEAAPPSADQSCMIAFVRFTGDQKPTIDDLAEVAGVRRVHSLCSGWDFMVEVGDAFFPADRPTGSIELLGRRVEVEVAALRTGHDRHPARAAPARRSSYSPRYRHESALRSIPQQSAGPMTGRLS